MGSWGGVSPANYSPVLCVFKPSSCSLPVQQQSCAACCCCWLWPARPRQPAAPASWARNSRAAPPRASRALGAPPPRCASSRRATAGVQQLGSTLAARSTPLNANNLCAGCLFCSPTSPPLTANTALGWAPWPLLPPALPPVRAPCPGCRLSCSRATELPSARLCPTPARALPAPTATSTTGPPPTLPPSTAPWCAAGGRQGRQAGAGGVVSGRSVLHRAATTARMRG